MYSWKSSRPDPSTALGFLEECLISRNTLLICSETVGHITDIEGGCSFTSTVTKIRSKHQVYAQKNIKKITRTSKKIKTFKLVFNI